MNKAWVGCKVSDKGHHKPQLVKKWFSWRMTCMLCGTSYKWKS